MALATVQAVVAPQDANQGGLPDDCALCDPDVDHNGNIDQDDVLHLANVLADGENPTGRWADYNRDGNEDQDDLLALVHTIAGGGCPWWGACSPW
ncbi:MAG: hypothetical protein WAZ94_03265 [Phycisphaerales bacterium]